MPRGGSLARLLARERGVRNIADLPPLMIKKILAWADEHHEHTGKWPISDSANTHLPEGETWCAIDLALRAGRRGLSGRSSLAQLLARERGVRNVRNLPSLSVPQILGWADQHRAQTGKWPKATSSPVAGMDGETWSAVNAALWRGMRGLRGGESLAKLLARERRVRYQRALPRLTANQILQWADDHHRRTGRWPTAGSGAVLCQRDENWANVAQALHVGLRGLPGGDSLARLLARKRGTRHRLDVPRYTLGKILAWADAHRAKYGVWPNVKSGAVDAAPGETWTAIQVALTHGTRGLPGGDSLAQLLARRRGKRNRRDLPPLTVKQILAWADAHLRRHGMWPTELSGTIADAPGETWQAMNQALRSGLRGLPGGSSLSKLLAKHRRVGRHQRRPPLSVKQILAWADKHYRRTGRWPNENSGAIHEAPGETWRRVQNALRGGKRKLPSGWSLAKLFAEHRGMRSSHHRPRLEVTQILRWARAYQRKHGRWPNRHSGPIDGEPGENWGAVDAALKGGHCGLPGGSSLARLRDRKPH